MDDRNTGTVSGQSQRNRVILGAASAAIAGAVLAIILSWSPSGRGFTADGGKLIGYMAAAISMTALLGLVFGIPRARTDADPRSASRFSNNSNLEQISDWLTKILVGAGLVQLAAAPAALRALGDYLGAGMNIANSAALTVAFVVYGSGIGFLAGYLWARLRLRVMLETNEKDAEDAARFELESVLTEAAAAAEGTTSKEEISRAAELASRVSKAETTVLPVLWVDDNPSNNSALILALKAVNIPVSISRSTADAMVQLTTQQFGLVITDLGREESGTYVANAGLDLLNQLQTLKPVPRAIVYASKRALAQRTELTAAGAILVTTSPVDLFSAVVVQVGADARFAR